MKRKIFRVHLSQAGVTAKHSSSASVGRAKNSHAAIWRSQIVKAMDSLEQADGVQWKGKAQVLALGQADAYQYLD